MKYNYRVVKANGKYRIQFNRMMSKKRWTADSKRISHPQAIILCQEFNCKEDAIKVAKAMYLQERVSYNCDHEEVECIVIEYRDCH